MSTRSHRQTGDGRPSHRKLVRKLVLVAVGMFGFGFALVPLYDIFCEVTGLNGKTGRIAAEGVVDAYIHAGGKIGVLIEVNCETDFVARTDEFQQLVKDLAMHIAAAEPRFVRREEVTEDVLDSEREIYREQVRLSGKPEHLVDRIVDGKMGKFYSEAVLLEQPYVKNPDQKIERMIEHFQNQLRSIEEDPLRPVSEFSLLAESERHQFQTK